MKGNFSKVISNCLSLIILQSGNYIVPLVLTPYLIMSLGVDGFGHLSFFMAINVFFRVITSYGFDLTATKEVAENSAESMKVSEVFVSVITAKTLLFLICGVILTFLIVFIDKLNENSYLLLSFFLLVLADVFFPIWLYQGMQCMKVITVLKLSSKFLYVALAILFVNSTDDIIYVPLLEGGIALIISIFSFIWGVKRFNLDLRVPLYKNVVNTLLNSMHIFMSKASVLFYTSFNTVLLGFLFSTTAVGYYSVAEKLYMGVRELFNPVIQSIFPFLASMRKSNYLKYKLYVRLAFFILLGMLSILSLLMSNFGGLILNLLLEAVPKETLEILWVFSLSLIFAVGGYLSSILVIEERGKVLSQITFFSVIVNLILIYPLTSKFGGLGVAYCFLIVQIIHFILQVYVNRSILRNVSDH